MRQSISFDASTDTAITKLPAETICINRKFYKSRWFLLLAGKQDFAGKLLPFLSLFAKNMEQYFYTFRSREMGGGNPRMISN